MGGLEIAMVALIVITVPLVLVAYIIAVSASYKIHRSRLDRMKASARAPIRSIWSHKTCPHCGGSLE